MLFLSQHLPSHLFPPPALVAPEQICSYPKSVEPEVLGWAAVMAVALLGKPGPPASWCPAGGQALVHSFTLSSTYALTQALTYSLMDFLVDCSVV